MNYKYSERHTFEVYFDISEMNVRDECFRTGHQRMRESMAYLRSNWPEINFSYSQLANGIGCVSITSDCMSIGYTKALNATEGFKQYMSGKMWWKPLGDEYGK